ncbi:hypothetical protein MUP00_09140 [Candidatus Bathyarchaeota archaeon]|nr:hypothetical protein [Candidatus Bathyarchaeota archaeon]
MNSPARATLWAGTGRNHREGEPVVDAGLKISASFPRVMKSQRGKKDWEETPMEKAMAPPIWCR